jgi:hypothetical protein
MPDRRTPEVRLQGRQAVLERPLIGMSDVISLQPGSVTPSCGPFRRGPQTRLVAFRAHGFVSIL